MKNIRRVAVYCGSAAGSSPVFADATRDTAAAMVSRGVDLVYGGGRLGLMGAVASAALAAGGEVIGVIPEALANSEVANHDCTELHTVGGMHERKLRFTELSDGFVTIPGGVRLHPLHGAVESRPAPQPAEDPRPAHFKNTGGPWVGGI